MNPSLQNLKLLIYVFIIITSQFSLAQDSEELPQFEMLEARFENLEFVDSNNHEIVKTKKGKVFTLNYDLIPEESIHAYSELNDIQKESFHSTRKKIISHMAAVLNTQKLTIGFGLATKNKLVSIFKKEKGDPKKISDLGQGAIENILNSLNAKLWRESVKIADAKKISLTITPMLQITASAPRKLGGALGLTFVVGWDKEKEALFWDVQSNIEKIKSGFVFFAGFKATVGLAFDSSKTNESTRNHEVFFPLVLPVWDATGKDFYSFGMSTAISFPPPPITDAFTYINEGTRTSLRNLLGQFFKTSKLNLFKNSCYRLF